MSKLYTQALKIRGEFLGHKNYNPLKFNFPLYEE